MVNDDVMAEALRGPDRRFIEAGCTDKRWHPGLCVVVRTDTAFRLSLAKVIVGVVAERVAIPTTTCHGIELALHEAIANAIMHGNLEVHSENRVNIQAYGAFCESIERRLAQPGLACRCVTVHAWWRAARLCFAIEDEGAGFTEVPRQQAEAAPHGRGIRLMQDLARSIHWNQRRRRMILTFALTGPAAA
jgi:anti-sigma regulatory factor (Ser/Thr protein kinase)